MPAAPVALEALALFKKAFDFAREGVPDDQKKAVGEFLTDRIPDAWVKLRRGEPPRVDDLPQSLTDEEWEAAVARARSESGI